MKVYDAIVLGLGAMGSAATYQLAKRGSKVLGIDQFSPPHPFGSTHGDTRVTRQAIGEGLDYVPLVLRSHQLWREIETATSEKLLTANGALMIQSKNVTTTHHSSYDFLKETISAAKKYNIKHKLLDAKQIEKKFPQFNLRGDEVGYYEYGAGFVRPEKCVQAQLSLAEKYGAELRLKEKVLEYSIDKNKVRVKTGRGSYEAEKLVICAGPWLPELLGKKLKSLFKIYREVLYWFDIDSNYNSFLPENFPVFIWIYGKKPSEYIYGFPAIDGPQGGLKVATEEYTFTTTPDSDNSVKENEKIKMFNENIRGKMKGINSKCLRAVSCLYTVTPDSNFIIDNHPDFDNIIIASPCSGHGFKHSAAIGEVLAQLVIEGKSKIDIGKFALNRFFKKN